MAYIGTMKQIVVLLVLSWAAPVWAGPLSLSTISDYINGLDTVEANFLQTNADGSQDPGRLSIKRPGRARFDYDDPSEVVVVIGAGSIAIFDEYTTDAPEQYPLRRTPLNLILGRDVDLVGSPMVVDHRASGDRTLVIAQDPDNPETGQIGLYFEENPVRLAEWILVNGAGEQTRVQLSNFVDRDRLPDRMFSIRREIAERSD
ncbi:MAG: outer membrane lipoprotein carrier protein LolA [Pseudomonadota bacterium]